MKKIFFFMTLIVISLTACKKDWLDVKRDIKLVIPTTLEDMKLILKDDDRLTKDHLNLVALSGEDHYVPLTLIENAQALEKNTYSFQKDIFAGWFSPSFVDWDNAYNQIFTANVILEGLEKIPKTLQNQVDWNQVKGHALFLRAKTMFNLNYTFAKPYIEGSAATDLGTPIKRSAVTTESITRATVKENYDLIISDLHTAADLVKETTETIYDPTKAAIHGWLARIYLSMRKYDDALIEADKYLQKNSALIDFNNLDATSNYPINRVNVETVLYSEMSSIFTTLSRIDGRIADNFRATYVSDDLRSTVYFRNRSTGENGIFTFKATYSGSTPLYTGVATDEMFLVRAECLARAGRTAEAMQDLNTLLQSRWKTGTFVPYTAANANQALDVILVERRKELLWRGLRWGDLRRLNQESGRENTLIRTIGSQTFTLEPNDPKYIMPIPNLIISTNGIPQNIR